MKFDIVGDVHGQYDKLVALLSQLGYSESDGLWRHPERTAIFVGDLIDRGPKQLATVDLVRRMVEAGTARCILGNHEFNAVAWVTPDPEQPGKFLRDHDRPGNRQQHQAFLDAVEGTPRHQAITDWFKTLPLWLELPGLRVVHACWHEESMDVLRAVLGPTRALTDDAVLLGSRPGHPVFRALEVVCKGPEVELPAGTAFTDKEGKVRHEVRVRWWQDDLSTYRKAAIGPPGDMDMIPDAPMPSGWAGHPYSGPPVLFGHYWFSGTPTVISKRFACVDYSAARDGPLVAYRWDGESELSSEKLVWDRNHSRHIIRDVTPADYATLLRLNRESEHFLSPLSLPRLESLCAQAWYCRVAAFEGTVQGFLLALREGANYDSPNYQWFAHRYPEFVYIDRVVVDVAARGRHLAKALYDDLFARARSQGCKRITCEFDTDPPNDASRRFHARLGFHEVGAQRVAGGQKAVSLQEVNLTEE